MIEEEIASASTQAELGVLRSLLKDPSVHARLDLNKNEFSTSAYGELYGAIIDVIGRNEIPDPMLIVESLEKTTGRNWWPIVANIAKTSSNAANVEAYARIIKTEYQKRTVLDICENLAVDINSGNMDSVDGAIQRLMQLNHTDRKYDYSMKEVIKGAVEAIEKSFEAASAGKLVGIPSGLKALDEALGGFHNTDLFVVGARPAMGKTALLLNFLINCNVPAGMISSEMASDQVGVRSISTYGSVSSHKLRQGNITDQNDWSKITASAKTLMDRPIRVNDNSSISIIDIQRQARKWKYEMGLEILYVDYIQRIKGSDPRAETRLQVEQVTLGLKNLAKELGIPVVALAQVNRQCESRPDKRPHMGDLADASIIEKEADGIALLYRDEVYNPDTQYPGIAELDINKNRHGPTGIIRSTWVGEYMQFKDI